MKCLKPFDSSRSRIVRMWCAIGGDLLLGLSHLLLHLLLLLLFVCGGQKLFGGILVAVRLPHVHWQDRLGWKGCRAVQALKTSARSCGVGSVVPFQVAILMETCVWRKSGDNDGEAYYKSRESTNPSRKCRICEACSVNERQCVSWGRCPCWSPRCRWGSASASDPPAPGL